MKKKCTRCGYTKPYSEFYKAADNADGMHRWRKACRTIKTRLPPKSVRAINYDAKYGVNLDWVDFELKRRDYKCDICGEEEKTRACLSLDHDHATGKVRGFLCNNCNRGLGLLGDNPEILRKAAKYLEKHAS